MPELGVGDVQHGHCIGAQLTHLRSAQSPTRTWLWPTRLCNHNSCLDPQVQEPEEEDAVYLRRQQAAVDEINKRGLVLFHASIQVRMGACRV